MTAYSCFLTWVLFRQDLHFVSIMAENAIKIGFREIEVVDDGTTNANPEMSQPLFVQPEMDP